MRKLLFLVLITCSLLSSCAQQAKVQQRPLATFLHLNDTYRVDAVEDGERGGFARVVTLLRDMRQDGRDLRVLHGGDFLYPSLESQLWNGEQMIEAFNFMNALAPMYAVPGNHEFDRRTPDALIAAVRQSDFAWVGDNIQFKTGATDVDNGLRQAFVADIGGVSVGTFGLTLHTNDGGNDRTYTRIDPDYVAAAERAISRLESMGAEIIIGLTHLHLDDDRLIANLKRQHPTLHLLVGGHEHEPEFEAGTATSATIVKGASNARTIWAIDLNRDANGKPQLLTRRIAVDSGIEPDAQYSAEIAQKWRRRLLDKIPFLEATLGRAAVPLDARETAVRNEESNWGVFIAEQMRGAFGQPSQLAFINGGTLRIDDFIIGDITFEDVGRTFGFSSFLRHMTITGRDFKTLLENGYRGTGPSKGYFPQIAGFRVCVDRSRPNGQRIVSLQVPDGDEWKEIVADMEYALVAPDYLYRGGDGYDFAAAQQVSLPGSELKYLVVDAIVRAQATGQLVGAATDPQNLRIVVLDENRRYCW